MIKVSILVFIATFVLGIAVIVFRNDFFYVDSKQTKTSFSEFSNISNFNINNEENIITPSKPLRLPDSAKIEYKSKDGWEYSGIVNANFVSARAQLESWMQNQDWIPEKKITLDENIEPKIILTFTRGKEEMTVFIWKISIASTGFAYKRESVNNKKEIFK